MIAFSVFDACVLSVFLVATLVAAIGVWRFFCCPTENSYVVRGLSWLIGTARRRITTELRCLELEPNKWSDLKIEKYLYAMNGEIVFGTPSDLLLCNSPDTSFRIQGLRSNVPWPGIVAMHDIRTANVSCTVGGQIDLYTLHGDWADVDWPTLTSANKTTAFLRYNGEIPEGREKGSKFSVCITMRGPAAKVA